MFTGFLLLALKLNKSKYYIGLGLAFALAFLNKPAGLFLTPVIFLIAFFVLYTKKGWKKLLYLYAPPVVLLFAVLLYNYQTLGVFNLTTQGATDRVANTFTFIETDPQFPDYMNQAIKENILAKAE